MVEKFPSSCLHTAAYVEQTEWDWLVMSVVRHMAMPNSWKCCPRDLEILSGKDYGAVACNYAARTWKRSKREERGRAWRGDG